MEHEQASRHFDVFVQMHAGSNAEVTSALLADAIVDEWQKSGLTRFDYVTRAIAHFMLMHSSIDESDFVGCTCARCKYIFAEAECQGSKSTVWIALMQRTQYTPAPIENLLSQILRRLYTLVIDSGAAASSSAPLSEAQREDYIAGAKRRHDALRRERRRLNDTLQGLAKRSRASIDAARRNTDRERLKRALLRWQLDNPDS